MGALAVDEQGTVMRSFEIYDSSKRKRDPLAVLYCEEGMNGRMGEMRIVVNPSACAEDLPLMLSLFVQRGDREIPDEWARRWVEERIPPQGRQNLGEILRANGLDSYDEIALLAASEGRSSQDDCLLREVRPPRVDYAFASLGDGSESDRENRWCAMIGPEIARRRKAVGMTQRDLSEKTGIGQAAISRIESGNANPTLNTLDALVEGIGFDLLVRIV